MDGLEEFEKSLAAEKVDREKDERRHARRDKRKLKHHHRHRSREDEENRDRHRYKRSRHATEDQLVSSRDDGNHRSSKAMEAQENTRAHEPASEKLQRDSWMTEPSGLDVDYTQKGAKRVVEVPKIPIADQNLKLHKNELNLRLHETTDGKALKDLENEPAQHEVSYLFGDAGASWRMTRLKAVRAQAEQSGRSVEEVAIERFGSLREFDDAREEEIELDRRKIYGDEYVGKEKPSGDLFQERKMDMGIRRPPVEHRDKVAELPQGEVMDEKPVAIMDRAIDSTRLNRLKAQLMKAKLKSSPEVGRLEAEYEAAATTFANTAQHDVIVLNQMDNRMLAGNRGEVKAIESKRGRERQLVEENEDMSIEDMLREERRTRGQAGGDSIRAAERIAKDAKFETDLDYMDDNANQLAKRVQKSDRNLKNAAVNEYQKVAKLLENCPLCHQEDKDQPPLAPIVSLATRVYLTLPTEPELSDGGAVIVPIQHKSNLLECDEDEWEEIRNFMKCLTRMYHGQGRDVVFYENAAAPRRRLHAAMQVVPLPYSLGETAPAFFKEAILSSDEEWTQHRKLIDTAARARDGMGKSAFRKSIAKEMPYFHVWFGIDGGLGHIVEDFNRWPRGDLFAREIIGGMLDIEPDVIRRQGRWTRDDKRVDEFRKRWRGFDWTKALTDG